MFSIRCSFSPHPASAIGEEPRVSVENRAGGFPLSAAGRSTPVYASSGDYPGVLRVLRYFQNDVAAVTGAKPEMFLDQLPSSKEIVLVGTLGRSPLIDRLVREKKVDVHGIAGVWEASLVQSVDNPFPGVDRALVITGSDKRGTIYGMFGISEQIGVSPWYWWADVPVKHHKTLFVLPGRHPDGPPSVKYRGIFLNDEWPALTNWIRAKYGDVQHGQEPADTGRRGKLRTPIL